MASGLSGLVLLCSCLRGVDVGIGGFMQETFPKAVVWDSDKRYHHDVAVDHVKGVIMLYCRESGIATELTLHDLEFVKASFKRSTEAQVVSWVEIYG